MEIQNIDNTLENLCREWKERYYDERSNCWINFSENAEMIYNKLMKLKKDNKLTYEAASELIDSSWFTHFCNGCGKPFKEGVNMRGFYCKSCIREACKICQQFK